MTVNNWDGKITREMFDFSQMETSYGTFIQQVKRYLTSCLVGSAHLTGEGSLLEYFDELMEEAVERGEIALLEYPDTQEKFLAIPRTKQENTEEKVKENLLKEPINLEFQLLDNSNEILAGSQVEKYVIFKFNRAGTAHLTGLDFWTKRLVNILMKIEKEMFMNEKRLIFFSPETPDEFDIKKWLKTFNDGIITLITFDKSANPDKEAIAKGKQGINPSLVKFEVYEPKEFHEEKYRQQFAFVWTNMERAYGIRHDTLQEKEERASVSEFFSSQANFEAQEKKIYRLLIKSIREYNRIFEEGKGNYQFKFGRIGN
jgi:hypothetical protein